MRFLRPAAAAAAAAAAAVFGENAAAAAAAATAAAPAAGVADADAGAGAAAEIRRGSAVRVAAEAAAPAYEAPKRGANGGAEATAGGGEWHAAGKSPPASAAAAPAGGSVVSPTPRPWSSSLVNATTDLIINGTPLRDLAHMDPDDYFVRGNDTGEWHYPRKPGELSLPRDVPALRKFYFGAELTFNPVEIMWFSRANSWISWAACAVYLVAIFGGRRLMRNRAPFDLRTPLKYWNLFLAAYSFMGTVRIVPHVLLLIARYGFDVSLCAPSIWTYGDNAAGLWITLFVYSKFLELFDTVFIVLRKKPLMFLHWYHHVTVLLYCFDAFINEQPPGLHFAAMNYLVHSVMYFYYFLAAARRRPPAWGVVVTVMQVAQMVGGLIITTRTLYYATRLPYLYVTTRFNALDPFRIPGCYAVRYNLVGCLLMYSTYFYLFAKFFVDRYVLKPAAVAGKAALKEKKGK